MSDKYAVFSNFYVIEPQQIELLQHFLKKESTAIVINGDFTRNEYDEETEIFYSNYSKKILEAFAKTNLEIFVNPGLQENKTEYYNILSDLKRKYGNIIDTTKDNIIKRKNHELFFLPGIMIDPEMVDEEQFFHTMKNFQDLSYKIKNPEKTIMFTLNPPLFETPTGVDYLTLWELQRDTILIDPYTNQEILKREGALIDETELNNIIDINTPVRETYMNIGNETIRTICKTKGLDKIVLNFESGLGKFHNWREQEIKNLKYSQELICTPSLADEFRFSIINIKQNKTSYLQCKFENLEEKN